MTNWLDVCAIDDIELEDVISFKHEKKLFAIYRSPRDTFHATDGLCTHEKVHLSSGFVMDFIIECPKHNGRFDYRTGKARGAPVCIDLQTYPVKTENGRVYLDIG